MFVLVIYVIFCLASLECFDNLPLSWERRKFWVFCWCVYISASFQVAPTSIHLKAMSLRGNCNTWLLLCNSVAIDRILDYPGNLHITLCFVHSSGQKNVLNIFRLMDVSCCNYCFCQQAVMEKRCWPPRPCLLLIVQIFSSMLATSVYGINWVPLLCLLIYCECWKRLKSEAFAL